MKQILISLMAVAALVSCSKSESLETPNDGTIRVITGIEAPGTKAVVTQTLGVTDVAFRLIHAAAKPSDFTTATALKGNIAATTGAVTFDPSAPKYETANDHNAWFIGYYPAGTATGTKITWTIDGKTDILRTESVWDAGKFSAPVSTGMTFQHQLSQVEVLCIATSSAALSAVQSAWGNIKSISFKDAPTEMEFDYAALTVANGTSKADKALSKDYNGTAFTSIAIPANNSTVINAMAMLAPVTKADAAKSFELIVVTEGKTTDIADDITTTVPVKVAAATGDAEDMVKGKTHKVTLTFDVNGKDISATQTTINAWQPGSEGSGSLKN